MANADIIITHGGPATFMGAIAKGKKPIVVPRLEKFGEHVNDHQIEFAIAVQKNRLSTIFTVTDISELEALLKLDSDKFVVDNSKSYNSQFVDAFAGEVEELLRLK